MTSSRGYESTTASWTSTCLGLRWTAERCALWHSPCFIIVSTVVALPFSSTTSAVAFSTPSSLIAHRTRRSQHSQECKNARRHCFVHPDVDLSPFDPQINGFPALIVVHFYVKFGNPSFIDFWDIVGINWQADKRQWKPYHRNCRRRGVYS